jgi:uncharacterized membrane protein YeaQ/YmgE (transglycosylase-associated protein family)
MDIVWTAIIGLVIGLIARLLKPGPDSMGLIMTALVGIGGALLATWAGHYFGFYAEGQKAGFIAAVVGAVVLLVGLSMVRSRG